MVRDDPVNNIKFVQVIEKHPHIYNFTLADYSKKEATDAAWQKVATEMNDTVQNCKERWRNLRTVFVRKMKLPPPGSGSKGTKRYYLMDFMQFLLPYVKVYQPMDTAGTVPSPGQTSEVVKEEEVQESDGEQSEENVAVECDVLLSTQDAEASTNAKSNPKVKKRSNESATDQTVVDFANMKRVRVHRPTEEDPRRHFLLSLIPDVHAMTDGQMRKFKRLVLDAVDTVLDGPSISAHTSLPSTENKAYPSHTRNTSST